MNGGTWATSMHRSSSGTSCEGGDMRTHIATMSLLMATACGGGNWSNQDLEFLHALPQREELRSKLPAAETSSSGLTGVRRDGLAVGDPSEVYADTKRSSDAFNGLLDAL